MGALSNARRSDGDLLAAACVGDPDAFAEFYSRHEALVVAYLRRRLPQADLAADLTAETFASALSAAGRFDAGRSRDGRAVGWLLTIAHHQLLSSLRRGRVADETRRRLQMSEPLILHDAALERVDELASLPEGLDEVLADLPAELRTAVLSRVVDEEPYAQIAAELRCSELVVRQRVSRGLARLRRQLLLENT